jgi:hypothetical protein
MATNLETAFLTSAERALITHEPYGVFGWDTDHRLTYPTIELTLGVDGYQQLATDAALGRQVSGWRARNPHLAALLDAEAALDALTR